MQLKTIAKVCRKKINDWIYQIKKSGNSEIAQIISDNTIITGGSIASMLSGAPINDFDIYFRNRKAAFRVAQYYVELYKKQNSKYIAENKLKIEIVEDSIQDKINILVNNELGKLSPIYLQK